MSLLEQHFDVAFAAPDGIKKFRELILTLAMQGKLVPQDPNDEPASELLRSIEVEKNRLVKEGKIKKPKPLLEIKADEVPYDLPDAWAWVRLGWITSKITDGDHQTPPRISEGCRLLSAKNVRDGYLDFDNCDLISEEHYLKSRERCCPEFNDLLIVSVGGTIGRTSLIPKDSSFALVRSVALIKPLLIDSSYLKYSMDSSLLQTSIHMNKRGGAQPCLYLSEIEKFLFSLPPLAEQRRIVAKIDQLMARCDELEKLRIDRSQRLLTVHTVDSQG
jgi:type I restriction enzyme, S subunit